MSSWLFKVLEIITSCKYIINSVSFVFQLFNERAHLLPFLAVWAQIKQNKTIKRNPKFQCFIHMQQVLQMSTPNNRTYCHLKSNISQEQMLELQTKDHLKGGPIQIQKSSCWRMDFLEQYRMDARMHRNNLRMQDIPLNKHDKKPITTISGKPTPCILQLCGKLFLEKQELMLK